MRVILFMSPAAGMVTVAEGVEALLELESVVEAEDERLSLEMAEDEARAVGLAVEEKAMVMVERGVSVAEDSESDLDARALRVVADREAERTVGMLLAEVEVSDEDEEAEVEVSTADEDASVLVDVEVGEVESVIVALPGRRPVGLLAASSEVVVVSSSGFEARLLPSLGAL